MKPRTHNAESVGSSPTGNTIKQGDRMPTVIGQDPSVKKTTTCLNCGAVIQYVKNDVRFLGKCADYGGGVEMLYGFNCPQCSKEVYTPSY